LPVSSIANFNPVIIGDLRHDVIEGLLKSHPYQHFPFAPEGKLMGTLSRKEAEAALVESRAPKIDPATTCGLNQTIRELQMLLIGSTTQVVVIVDPNEGRPVGLVTLHDLLRAQVQKASETSD
jgi:CBS domain-containing protein